METAKAALDGLEPFIVNGMVTVKNQEFTQRTILLEGMKTEYAKAEKGLEIFRVQLDDVNKKIEALPVIEAELADLRAVVDRALEERDQAELDIQPYRDRTESLRTVRQRAGAWEEEATFKDRTFEILTHARKLQDPEDPMDIIILVFSFFIGLGFGVVLSLMKEMLKLSFTSREEVVFTLGKPVLGAVCAIMTQAELRSVRFKKFVFTTSSLLLIFTIAAILFICNNYPQLIPQGIVETVNQIRDSLM